MAGRDLNLKGRFDYQSILVGFNTIIPKAREFQSALAGIQAAERKVAASSKSFAVAPGFGGDNMAFGYGLKIKVLDDLEKKHKAAADVAEKSATRQKTAATGAAQAEAQSSNVGVQAANAEKAAVEARTRAYEDWLRAKAKQPVEISNRESLAGFIGPQRPLVNRSSIAEPPRNITPQMMADYAKHEEAEKRLTRTVAQESGKRIGIKGQEASATKAALLQVAKLEYDAAYAIAKGYNNQFDRFDAVERAKTALLKKQLQIRYGDSEKFEQMMALVDKRYGQARASNQIRRLQFADTPFQQMIGQQGAVLGFLSKLGMSGKQTGMIFQQAGYQVGDFAVQVGSGQGVMRPFLQQFTQLVQFFGPWGSVIGAGTAILGALTIGLIKSKKAAESLKDTSLPEWLQPGNLEASRRELDQLVKSQADLFAGNIAGPSIGQVQAAIKTSIPIIGQYARELEAVSDATGSLGGVTVEQAAKFRVYSDAVDAEISKANSRQMDAQSRLDRALIEGRDESLSKRLDALKNTQADELRQVREHHQRILNSTKSTPEEKRSSTAALDAKNVNSELNLTQKRHREEQRNEERSWNDSRSKELIEAERQTQRMRIETQMVGGARAIALINHEYDERVKAAKGKAAVIAQIEAQRVIALDAQQAAASRREQEDYRRSTDAAYVLEVRRQEVLNHGNEQALLSIKQYEERRRLETEYNDQLIRDAQEGNYALLEERHAQYQAALTATAFIHEQERQQAVVKAVEENAKKQTEAYRMIGGSLMSLSDQFANTFNVRPMQKANMVLREVLATVQALAALSKGVNLLAALANPFGALGGLFMGALPGTGIPAGMTDMPGLGGLAKPGSPQTPNNLAKPTADYANAYRPPVIPASVYTPMSKPSAAPMSVTIGGATVHITGSVTPQQAREIGREVGRGQAEEIAKIGSMGTFAGTRAFQTTGRDATFDRVPG